MHGTGLGHPDHCIETLRQYLMCHADISVVSWRRDEGNGQFELSTTVHVCRKWDPIWNWALEHRMPHAVD
jgi:hypothetical protein